MLTDGPRLSPGLNAASGIALAMPGLIEPGGDLLFRRLSGSTIGAEGFHGRVRDGIGCFAPRYGHQVFGRQISEVRKQNRATALSESPDPAGFRRKRVVRCLRRGVCRLISDF